LIFSTAFRQWATHGWSLLPQWWRTDPWNLSILSVENRLVKTYFWPLSSKWRIQFAVERLVKIIASNVSLVKHSKMFFFCYHSISSFLLEILHPNTLIFHQ
jgi:hypothetical protein